MQPGPSPPGQKSLGWNLEVSCGLFTLHYDVAEVEMEPTEFLVSIVCNHVRQ